MNKFALLVKARVPVFLVFSVSLNKEQNKIEQSEILFDEVNKIESEINFDNKSDIEPNDHKFKIDNESEINFVKEEECKVLLHVLSRLYQIPGYYWDLGSC